MFPKAPAQEMSASIPRNIPANLALPRVRAPFYSENIFPVIFRRRYDRPRSALRGRPRALAEFARCSAASSKRRDPSRPGALVSRVECARPPDRSRGKAPSILQMLRLRPRDGRAKPRKTLDPRAGALDGHFADKLRRPA